MSDYDNTNRLSLWLNDKRKEATHPHLTGQGETIEPVYANAWFSKDLSTEDARALQHIIKRYSQTSNKPFLNISLKPKEERAARQTAAPYEREPGSDDDLDDSLPF